MTRNSDMFAAVAGNIQTLRNRPPTDDKHEQTRRDTGIVYVLELQAGGAALDTRGYWKENAQSTRDLVRRALAEQLFANRLAAGAATDEQAGVEVHFLAQPLLETEPDLARFLLLQIRGFTFDELEAVLHGFEERNAYDFGYALHESLNDHLGAQSVAAPTVVRAAPDKPFSISCHPVPTNPKGNWPLDLDHMDVAGAWDVIPRANGKRHGEGIRVAHLDTGRSLHPALSAGTLLALGDQYDAVDDDNDALDHLVTTLVNSEPGHGTSTATQIASASRSDPSKPLDPAGVLGVAGMAEIVPIRVCDSTAFVFNFHLARGLAWAIAKNCHVVSMSVGGFFIPGFEALAEVAYRRNMLLIAAGGNCMPFTVWPARLPQCLAVGASDMNGGYWEHAPSDSRIDVAAPGDSVPTTLIELVSQNPDRYKYSYNAGSGTSFSTAYVSGVACLWLALLGGDKARIRQPLQSVFSDAVKASATLRPWSKNGTGIINARKLLDGAAAAIPTTQAPVPAPGLLARLTAFFYGLLQLDSVPVQSAPVRSAPPGGATGEAAALLSALSEIVKGSRNSEAEMLADIRRWFGLADDAAAMAHVEAFGGEMANALIADAAAKHGTLEALALDAETQSPVNVFARRGSKTLREKLSP